MCLGVDGSVWVLVVVSSCWWACLGAGGLAWVVVNVPECVWLSGSNNHLSIYHGKGIFTLVEPNLLLQKYSSHLS